MALTRAMLKEMGVTEKEIIDNIMEAHGETIETAKAKATATAETALNKQIDALKKQLDEKPDTNTDGEDYKTKAETAQKTLDKLTADHEKIKGEFDTYKTNVETKATTSAQDKALQALLKQQGANEKLIPLLLKNINRESVQFDGDHEKGFTVKDTKFIDPLKTEYAEIFGTVQTEGAKVATPPAGTGGTATYTAEQLKTMTPAQINENWDKGVKQSLERSK